ncbi:hypothetical protein AB0F72_32750 [Actinoplanes sp. NPDC023936]|uniref:hypothetical protein n=1 Tax=Actinoplanes sp. NPDC023936 TaxID=3154910 RepID=UPI0033D1D3AA
MSSLYDYFRAPGAAAIREHMDENEADSPVPDTFDGIQLKTIDPSVILSQLIASAMGREWGTDLVDDRLVWPEDGEQDLEHEGPWVTALNDRCRDVLAGITADRVPELAEQWATVEEFGGYGDADYLRDVITDFVALAIRARERGESLYCWMTV